MQQARRQHPNASLTPEGRRKMVALVIDEKWSIEATAERFQLDAKTVRKWRDRFLTEGEAGLQDRSSRQHRSPNRTLASRRKRAIDDRTRLAYSEILGDEQAITAAGFWTRAEAWFSSHGIRCERVITDNGPCYRSMRWFQACATTATTIKKTRPRRPQTNGKVERFHRILLEEWAYIRAWTSDRQRTNAYPGFIHFYNHHRAHGSLGWSTPAATLNTFRDNVPGEHT